MRICLACPVLFFSFLLVIMVPARLHADTFTTYFVSDDQNKFFEGVNSSGQVLIDKRFSHQSPCTVASDDCYYTVDAGKTVAISTTKAGFVADDGLTSCNFNVPSGARVISEVCNGGHAAWDGYLSNSQVFPSLYAGLSNTGLGTGLGYADGRLFMNSSGDIVWDDQFAEAFYEAIPDPVPEPSSLILLGSGMVGLLGAAFRRKCATV